MEKEIWKVIPDTQERYEISSFGRVRSIERTIKYSDGRIYKYPSKILHLTTDAYGYHTFQIRNHGKHCYYKVHRVVATVFIPNPLIKREVNHKNGLKTDNRVANLEWVTSSENKVHAIKNHLSEPTKNLRIVSGSKHHAAKTLILYKNGREIKRYKPMAEAQKDGIRLPALFKQRKLNRPYKGMTYKII